MNAPPTTQKTRSWRVPRARSLVLFLLVAIVVATGFIFAIPYRRQMEALRCFDASKVQYRTEPVGPEWLRNLIGEDRMRGFDRVDWVEIKGLRNDGNTSIKADVKLLANLNRLNSLDLLEVEVTDEGFAEIALLPQLKELVIDSVPITDQGLKHLATSRRLESLNIYSGRITDLGLEYITRMLQLEYLSLSALPISDEGVKQIAKLTRLKSLSLDDLKITDQGVANLTKMPPLTDLSLINAPITDAAIPHLEKLTELQNLDLFGTQVSEEGLNSLRKRLPHCKIYHHSDGGYF